VLIFSGKTLTRLAVNPRIVLHENSAGRKSAANSILREALMETPILSDKSQFPTDKIIFSHIGKSKTLWGSLFRYLAEEHPDFTSEWRYYNDGKSWLMKVQHKKKTVFWLSIIKGSFRTTFYIHEKAKKIIDGSTISEKLKDQYRTGKGSGKIRGIRVVYKSKKDLEDAKELIGIKIGLK
jgi:hypothetical protein